MHSFAHMDPAVAYSHGARQLTTLMESLGDARIGHVLTLGLCLCAMQVWSAATGWKAVPGCAVAPMLTNDIDPSKQDVHAKLFAWGKGKIFQVRIPTEPCCQPHCVRPFAFMPGQPCRSVLDSHTPAGSVGRGLWAHTSSMSFTTSVSDTRQR